MKINVKMDMDRIPVGTDFTVRAMLEMEADGPVVETKAPLNLALVLDRSGSMAGEKLRNVKKAAQALVAGLADTDIFSLTIFDDDVTPLVQPCMVRNAGINEDIDGIRSGGSTFLSGGYEQGRRFINQSRNAGNISRVILLTDGLANRGIQSVEGLAGLASEMRAEGITTTTLGVGMDYNEELLGRMAEVGGGGAYFIERADEAEAVFNEELRTLKTLSVTGCEVTFVPSKQIIGFDQMNTFAEPQHGTYVLGDVYGGVTKRLVLELRVQAMKQPGPFSAGTFTINYKDAAEDGLKDRTMTLDVAMEAVTREEFNSVEPDQMVSCQAALCLGAIAKKKARELAVDGRFDDAAGVLDASAEAIAVLNLDDAAVKDLVKDLKTRARRMRQEREQFFTGRERKRMYHESNMTSKSVSDKLAFMVARRRN